MVIGKQAILKSYNQKQPMRAVFGLLPIHTPLRPVLWSKPFIHQQALHQISTGFKLLSKIPVQHKIRVFLSDIKCCFFGVSRFIKLKGRIFQLIQLESL